MFFSNSKVSLVFTTIFIFRYFGLFPYSWKNSKVIFNRKESTNRKLVLNSYFYCNTLILILGMSLAVLSNSVEKLDIFLEKEFSTEGISYLLLVIVISSLYILYWIMIITNIRKLKFFINFHLKFFMPIEIKIDWFFKIYVLSSIGFIGEMIVRILIHLYESNLFSTLDVLIQIYKNSIFRGGYLLLFYSVNLSFSKQWELINSSKFLKPDFSNLESTIKISNELVKSQNKSNHLFSNLVSICLITNIFSVIFNTFLIIVRSSNYNLTINEIKYISTSILQTILVCDVSEKLNTQVSLRTF